MAADRKKAPAERSRGRPAEPSACERCGAIFSGRAWRRPRGVSMALLGRARWRICPACRQVGGEEYWGRVLIRGRYAVAHEAEVRQRIENVAGYAQHTQPERRLVSTERQGDVLEVLTTSQKLAHRIVHELKKTFRGRARYQWSDDGSLYAVWERDEG